MFFGELISEMESTDSTEDDDDTTKRRLNVGERLLCQDINKNIDVKENGVFCRYCISQSLRSRKETSSTFIHLLACEQTNTVIFLESRRNGLRVEESRMS